MISSLHGTVLSAGTDHVVIEVGGVGFLVYVPADVARSAQSGHSLRLHTSLIVREDALTLYGFEGSVELAVFGQLLGVTGVGPKSALGVLGHLSVDQISAAVADDDDAPFRRVSGIGPKTAKLIVVQLAGKLPAPVASPTGKGTSAVVNVTLQTTAALVGLGWSERIAEDAVEQALETASETEQTSVAALLRHTLALLGPAQQTGAARG